MPLISSLSCCESQQSGTVTHKSNMLGAFSCGRKEAAGWEGKVQHTCWLLCIASHHSDDRRFAVAHMPRWLLRERLGLTLPLAPVHVGLPQQVASQLTCKIVQATEQRATIANIELDATYTMAIGCEARKATGNLVWHAADLKVLWISVHASGTRQCITWPHLLRHVHHAAQCLRARRHQTEHAAPFFGESCHRCLKRAALHTAPVCRERAPCCSLRV